MRIRCSVLGHAAGPIHYHNQSLDFALCHGCGCDLVRSADKNWAEVPQGFRVVWRSPSLAGDAAAVAERMRPSARTAPRRAPRNALPALRRDPRGRPLRGAASMMGVFAGLRGLLEGEAPDISEIDPRGKHVIILPSAGTR